MIFSDIKSLPTVLTLLLVYSLLFSAHMWTNGFTWIIHVHILRVMGSGNKAHCDV